MRCTAPPCPPPSAELASSHPPPARWAVGNRRFRLEHANRWRNRAEEGRLELERLYTAAEGWAPVQPIMDGAVSRAGCDACGGWDCAPGMAATAWAVCKGTQLDLHLSHSHSFESVSSCPAHLLAPPSLACGNGESWQPRRRRWSALKSGRPCPVANPPTPCSWTRGWRRRFKTWSAGCRRRAASSKRCSGCRRPEPLQLPRWRRPPPGDDSGGRQWVLCMHVTGQLKLHGMLWALV